MPHFRALVLTGLALAACSRAPSPVVAPKPSPSPAREQAFPLDPENIVNIAAGSKDHTTLVTALKAADYVKSVANPGPLTVFAPTNAAFDKLPAGTVENLLKPEQQAALKEVIKFHATTTAYAPETLAKMSDLAMANGQHVSITHVDGKLKINDANVIASIRGSNGFVHVIDAVLLPKD